MIKYCFPIYSGTMNLNKNIKGKSISFEFRDSDANIELLAPLRPFIEKYVEDMGDNYVLVKFQYFPQDGITINIASGMDMSEIHEEVAKKFEETHVQNFIEFYEDEKSKISP